MHPFLLFFVCLVVVSCFFVFLFISFFLGRLFGWFVVCPFVVPCLRGLVFFFPFHCSLARWWQLKPFFCVHPENGGRFPF